MKSRFLGIKKSTWLKVSLFFNMFLFVLSSTLFLLFLEDKNLWFYSFCLFTGLYLISKSMLFKFDSACYFGTLLTAIGFSYFYLSIIGMLKFFPVFLLISFAIASLSTYIFFFQSFHIFLAFSLLFSAVGSFLLILNLITIWIFVAFIVASMLLLVVRYFTLNRSR